MPTSLQLGYTDFAAAIGRYLSYGSEAANWTPEQVTEIDGIIQSGLRHVYYPPPINGIGPINWTFLKPLGQLVTMLPLSLTSTGVSTTSLTCTGAFAGLSLSGAVVLVTVGTTPYTRQVDSNTADTVTWLTTGVNGGLVTGMTTGQTFQVMQDDYDLPADFGRLIGPLMFSADDGRWWPIQVIDEQDIRRAREFPQVVQFAPFKCALSAKRSTGVAPQRYQLMFWPRPDKVYHLNFRYEATPLPISTGYPYPLGGANMSELFEAACMHEAELKMMDEEGAWAAHFKELLAASALKDRMVGPEQLGVNDNGQHGLSTLSDMRYYRGVTWAMAP